MANSLADPFQILGDDLLSEQGAVVVPNQLAFDQLLVLEKQLAPRPLAFLVEANAVFDPPLRSYLDREDQVLVRFDLKNSAESAETLRNALRPLLDEGRLVIFVPGRARAIAYASSNIPSEQLKRVIDTGARLHGLVVEHGHQWRSAIEEETPDPGPTFAFTGALEGSEVTLANYQEKMMKLAADVFRRQKLMRHHLGYAVLAGMKRTGNANGVIDGTDGSQTPYDRILAASLALSKVVQKRTKKPRVGIILPPGRGGLVANVAVLLAGKVPVNLNFTASKDAVDSAVRQADLDLYLTADPFREKLPRFSWPSDEQTVLLEKVLPKIKWKIAVWLMISKALSTPALAKLIGIPQFPEDPNAEAILLFTSGSSGEPKGVVLSHSNVLANVHQFGSRLSLRQTDRLLGCLPLFHSFGCTVTLWYPMMEGVGIVTFPSPVETKTLADLIEKHEIALVLGTPTFLRGYLRKATKEQFAKVNMVVSGAEKLPASLREAFKEKLGHEILEGYGLTETSPGTNANLPDPAPDADPDVPVMPSMRHGSVGQMLPGIAVRITDPDTDTSQSIHETGMIWLSGANIFQGYLNAPEKSADVLKGDWFKTGDIGRVDEDGFLYIEGRLSRFSKIGGEMVPHETLESYLNNALKFGSSDVRKLAVVGVPDEAKGEALVLLCVDADLDFASLRKHLIAEGVPALWVPKKWKAVDAIPCLASGKLDIRGCQELANEA